MAPFPAPPLATLRPVGLVVLASALLGSCLPAAGGPSGPDPFGGSAGGIIAMEVRNTLEEEVTVRVRADRFQRDLGQVSGRSYTRLSFPWADHGRLSVQIEPATGSRYTFPPMEVRAGELLELVIQLPIERSQLRR